MSNVEIERRFLVNTEKLPPLSGGRLLRQGYISTDPWVRVRIWGDGAQLTIKGRGDIQRSEVNIDIVDIEKAEAALRLFGRSSLHKTRTTVVFDGMAWVVDQFHGDLAGLWLAELELTTVDEEFASPPWLAEEVTTDHRYSNAWLAEHGLPPNHKGP